MATQRHLDIDVKEEEGRVVVAPRGEIDYGNVANLRSALLRLSSEEGADVLVDLGQVGFIDSTALSVLIQARQRMTGLGRRLTLTGAQARVARVLEITGMEGYFTSPTVTETGE